MNAEFDYVVSKLSYPRICDCQMEDFAFDRVESESLRVVITPFEDLKESFDRLIQQDANYVCINAIGIMDIVSLAEKAMSGAFKNIEFVFVTYDNFDIARANIVHHSPVLEKIEHLVAFMISSKFISFKKSISSAIEFLMTCERYAHIINHNETCIEQFVSKINSKIVIKIINLKEDTNGTR